jgi:hypothetical protein
MHRNRAKLFSLTVALPDEPKIFTSSSNANQNLSASQQDYQETREFSFGKSQTADEDHIFCHNPIKEQQIIREEQDYPDSGGSPNLNIFYKQ